MVKIPIHLGISNFPFSSNHHDYINIAKITIYLTYLTYK